MMVAEDCKNHFLIFPKYGATPVRHGGMIVIDNSSLCAFPSL